MIKIIVKNEPIFEEDFHQQYSVNCEYELDSEATATEALHMFCNAMILEGYSQKGIVSCLRKCADNIEEDGTV